MMHWHDRLPWSRVSVGRKKKSERRRAHLEALVEERPRSRAQKEHRNFKSLTKEDGGFWSAAADGSARSEKVAECEHGRGGGVFGVA